MDVALWQHKLVQYLGVTYCSTRVIDRLLTAILFIELYWILPYFVWGTAEIGQKLNIMAYVLVVCIAKWVYPFIHKADDQDARKEILESLDRGLMSFLLWIMALQTVVTPFSDSVKWTATLLACIQVGFWFTASALAWNTRPDYVAVIAHERIERE